MPELTRPQGLAYAKMEDEHTHEEAAMNVLAMSDLHAEFTYLKRVPEAIHNVDMVLV